MPSNSLCSVARGFIPPPKIDACDLADRETHVDVWFSLKVISKREHRALRENQ